MAEDQNRSLQDKFMLRLPDGMRDRLKSEAERNKRSLNAEIIQRLEFTLGMDDHEANYRQAPPPSSLSDYGTPGPPLAGDPSSADATGPQGILLDIKEELAALRAELIETRIMPDGRHEHLIRRKQKKAAPRQPSDE